MLIGCGCHCEEPIDSSPASGSFRSDSIASSAMQPLSSDSLDGGVQSHCGACYNLPRQWTVTLSSSWWLYRNPARDFDCRSGLGGTFILRPYGLGGLPGGWRPYVDGYAEELCTWWASTELAQNVRRLDRNGNPRPGCTDNTSGFPRVQLLSGTTVFGGAEPGCLNTFFILFIGWCEPDIWNDETLVGNTWSWIVPYRKIDNVCTPRNCIRCFGAYDNGLFGGSGLRAYLPDYSISDQWSPIGVCPA